MAAALTVGVVDDLAQLRTHEAEHAALRDRAGGHNPFAGPEWTLAWLEAFGGPRRRPLVLEARRGGDLVGVVPMWEQPSRLGGPVVRPVGRGGPWVGPFEIAGALALPGEGRDVGRAVVAALCERTWSWAHVALGDAAPWLEPDWLPSDDVLLLQRQSVSTVTLPLDGTPFRPRRNLRESLRRTRNRLDRDVGPDGWQVTRAVAPDQVAAAFDRLRRLHRERAARTDKAAIHTDVLGDAAVRAMVAAAVVAMAGRGLASVYELVRAEQVVAAQLVLHTRRSTHLSVSGQLPVAWDYSALTHLQWVAVQDAQAAGHELVDFSAGPIRAKLRWSDTVTTFPEFALVGPGRADRAAYLAELVRNSGARLLEASRANRRGAPERGTGTG